MQTGCRPCSCFLVGIDRAGGQQLREVGLDTLIEVGLTSSEIVQVYKILLKTPEATLAARTARGWPRHRHPAELNSIEILHI